MMRINTEIDNHFFILYSSDSEWMRSINITMQESLNHNDEWKQNKLQKFICDNHQSFFLLQMVFIAFSWLISPARTSGAMLKKSEKRKKPYLIPDLGKAFSLWYVVFHLIHLKVFSKISLVMSSFIYALFKSMLCIYIYIYIPSFTDLKLYSIAVWKDALEYWCSLNLLRLALQPNICSSMENAAWTLEFHVYSAVVEQYVP